MISNLHIIQTRVMYYLKLIKSYPCTTCFISKLVSDAVNRTKPLSYLQDKQSWVANGTWNSQSITLIFTKLLNIKI